MTCAEEQFPLCWKPVALKLDLASCPILGLWVDCLVLRNGAGFDSLLCLLSGKGQASGAGIPSITALTLIIGFG